MSEVTPPQLTKRQQTGARSREEILDVALRLMSEHGYDGASISRISAASGRPASSIYWHFGSKSGVLAAVMERGAERFFGALDAPAEVSDAPLSSRERLRAAYQRARAQVEKHPEFLRLMFVLSVVAPSEEAVAQVIDRVAAHGLAGVHRMLTAAYAIRGEAEARAIADRFALMAVTHFNGAFMSVPLYRSTTMERMVDDFADAIADAVEGQFRN